MRLSRRTESGQAFTELAIMGALAMAALAFMIQIGLRANYTQEIEMETFRAAMARARTIWDIEPQRVSYRQFRDRQVPDIEQGFASMPRIMTSSSSALTWATHLGMSADDDVDSQAMTLVNVNGVVGQFREDDFKSAAKNTPLEVAIDRSFTSSGSVTQPNATSSSTNTNSNQATTVTLKNGSQVTGGVASSVSWNW